MPQESLTVFFEILNILYPIFVVGTEIVKTWWWVVLPFIIIPKFIDFWLKWREDIWDSSVEKIIVEIKIPEEHLKPIRAMETVLNGMWQTIYGPPNWYEKWWKGEFHLKYSFEIASIDGVPHFFIRVPKNSLRGVETHIYAQYPEAEIKVVDDYTRKVPLDIPNKEWECWGTEYRALKPSAYPIRTYLDFESEHESEEEKRIDPMAGLLEGMTRLSPGEQLWVQIIAKPVLGNPDDGEFDWRKEAKQIRDKLVNRKAAEVKINPLWKEIWDVAVHGKVPERKIAEEKEVFPAEMKLSPGERDIVAAIERKISKTSFECSIRYMYVAKKENYFGGHIRIPMSYFVNFVTGNLNALVPWGETITKVKQNWYDWFWFVSQRKYLKKRRMHRFFIYRLSPKYPQDPGPGRYILTSDELATLYHFPSRTVAPAPFVPRVETKKGEAPSNLPVE